MRAAPGSRLAVALVLALVTGASADSFYYDTPEMTCPVTLEENMPACAHNSSLFISPANKGRDHHATNCAACTCEDPDTWHGLQCDLCNSDAGCADDPHGYGTCTRDYIAPYGNETQTGKVVSCTLGSLLEDDWTEQLVAAQPHTGFRFNFSGALLDGTADLHLNGFAGVPSAALASIQRYNYSRAWYFESFFSSCSVASVDVSVCENMGEWGAYSPTECIRYLCSTFDSTSCPPAGLEDCPRNIFQQCENVPGTSTKYWAHTCTGAVPDDATEVGLYCSSTVEDAANGTFICYGDLQLNSAFSLTCSVGGCSAGGAGPPIPVVDEPAEVSTELVLGALVGSLAGLLFASAAAYVHSDRKSRRAPKHTLGMTMGDADDLGALAPGAPVGRFEFRDVRYSVGSKKILRGASGVAAPSAHSPTPGLLAILGPSGAGKSTLLDCLAGRKSTGRVDARLYVNRERVEPKQMKLVSGYVLQEDVLAGTLTVREQLSFRATLMLPPSVTPKERESRVARLIAALGLQRCADNFIGDQFRRGISGGEKRRVSIGCELVLNPSILFLDEPTTGLDSANAATVVDLLEKLSRAGVIVLLTIHQPRRSIFRQLHRLLLLSDRGQMVYSGPAADGLAFFARHGHEMQERNGNPADFLLDTLIGLESDEVAAMVDSFELTDDSSSAGLDSVRSDSVDSNEQRLAFQSRSDSINGQRRASDPSAVARCWSGVAGFFWGSQGVHEIAGVPVKYRSGFFTQLRWLCWRLVRNTMRHPFVIGVQFVASLLMSLTLSGIDHDLGFDTFGLQNRFGLISFIVLFLGMMALSSVPVWREERILFLHERAQGTYGTSAYFTAVVLFDVIPLRLLPPCFFLFITYGSAGLHPDCGECLVVFLVILVLTNLCSTALAMAVGALPLSGPTANVIGSVSVLVAALFGGWLLAPSAIPDSLDFMETASFMWYAFEALANNEFLDQQPDDASKAFIYSGTLCGADLPDVYTTGRGVLNDLGYSDDGTVRYDAMRSLAIIFALLLGATLVLLLVVQHVSFALPSKADLKRLVNRERRASSLPPMDVEDDKPLVRRRGLSASTHESGSNDPVTLSWEDVNYHVKVDGQRRHIIKNVNGLVHGGSVMALVGPSGAGKTTLLDIIAGRKNTGEIAGTVSVSGQPTTAAERRHAFGYVLQDESGLPGAVTVAEHLRFHARLRLPATVSAEKRDQRVEAILTSLSLVKCCDGLIGDAYVRGISGGEKRRLSIAVELLTQPKVLCLDEPTTGLDATNAAKVINILASLARTGVTVMFSVHQPREDVLRLLDQVTLLSRYGQVVYSGATSEGLGFFAGFGLRPDDPHINPADYMLDLVMGAGDEIVDRLVEGFGASDIALAAADQRAVLARNPPTADEQLPAKYTAPFGTQLRALLWRQVLSAMRHPLIIGLHLGLGIAAALGLGFLLRDKGVVGPADCTEDSQCPNGGCLDGCYVGTPGIQSMLGALFFIVCYLTLLSLSSLPIFFENQAVLMRERAAGVYGTGAFFLATVLFDFGVLRVIPAVTFRWSYWMIGLNDCTACGWWFSLVVLLVNFCASGMAMAVGACTPTVPIANAVGSFAVCLYLLVGGFFVNLASLPSSWAWLADASFVNLAYNALLDNQFVAQGPFRITSQSSSVTTPSSVLTGQEVLSCFGFDTDAFVGNVLLLGIMAGGYLLLAFALLHFLFREKR